MRPPLTPQDIRILRLLPPANTPEYVPAGLIARKIRASEQSMDLLLKRMHLKQLVASSDLPDGQDIQLFQRSQIAEQLLDAIRGPGRPLSS